MALLWSGQGCEELESSSATVSVGQKLMALGADMGSWAMGRVGGFTGGLCRDSQSWWCLLAPENSLCFNIQVTFPTETESQKKKRAIPWNMCCGQPPFYKDDLTIKGSTATFERKKEKRLQISNRTSPLLVLN